MNSLSNPYCKHIAKAPRANASIKALSKRFQGKELIPEGPPQRDPRSTRQGHYRSAGTKMAHNPKPEIPIFAQSIINNHDRGQ